MQRTLQATSLVLFPLLILGYWLVYPAYGELSGSDIFRAIAKDTSATVTADFLLLAGSMLAIAATMALMRILCVRSLRLGQVGGTLMIVGWTALVGLAVVDIAAVELARGPAAHAAQATTFEQLYTNPLVITLNVMAAGHILGEIVIGIGLLRTKLIPMWASLIVIIAAPLHLASNLGGVLWLDGLTWIALAIALACAARLIWAGRAPQNA